jgi:hypothetical protein
MPQSRTDDREDDRGQQSAAAEKPLAMNGNEPPTLIKVKPACSPEPKDQDARRRSFADDITTDRRLLQGRPRPSIWRFGLGINLSRTSIDRRSGSCIE